MVRALYWYVDFQYPPPFLQRLSFPYLITMVALLQIYWQQIKDFFSHSQFCSIDRYCCYCLSSVFSMFMCVCIYIFTYVYTCMYTLMYVDDTTHTYSFITYTQLYVYILFYHNSSKFFPLSML